MTWGVQGQVRLLEILKNFDDGEILRFLVSLMECSNCPMYSECGWGDSCSGKLRDYIEGVNDEMV